MRYGLVIIMVALLGACSDPKEDGHVWKEQTQAIDKAKAAQGLIEDATVEQRKIIDEQAQ